MGSIRSFPLYVCLLPYHTKFVSGRKVSLESVVYLNPDYFLSIWGKHRLFIQLDRANDAKWMQSNLMTSIF